METKQLKTYGPAARRDFITAVTDRAALFGLTKKEIAPVTQKGDVAIISGQAFPREVAAKRARLEERIQRDGFDQVMEATAYTWFNRLMAIRYMELHGYLEHGYRVLSHPEGKVGPEILEHAAEVDLPGLDGEAVIELKLDGAKDEELYRLLLLAQCHALHKAMPFLFESLDDETELLLPDRLLHTDSLIRKLVEEIDESAWESIEIIGWLYQFYISEKKDQVIGKVVKSEDIPAATQLFTPNWIVKYMVQNSLGAQWLATYPQSPLKGQMEYYIEPAEQTDEVKAQLAASTPGQLNPEELTLIDPACGSGHILVEAYELFKAIYLERGYRQRDVPQLILEKNLFGLEICPRAAQLTGFALMMKGRTDDRRLFERGLKLNVMALVDSAGFDTEGLAKGVELGEYGLQPGDLTELKRLFEHATTFGSLIQVPEELAEKLPALRQLSEATSQDLFVSEALKRLGPQVRQAELLAAKYDAVVANPPYMGKGMNPRLKQHVTSRFPRSKSDLFAAFTERCLGLTKPCGFAGLMTSFTWLFLSSYESLRHYLLHEKSLLSLVQPEYHAFFESAFVPICTFVLQNRHIANRNATFVKLSDFYGAELQPLKTLEALKSPGCPWLFRAKPDEFGRIPGSPIAYWASPSVLRIFEESTPLGGIAPTRKGMVTANNDLYTRTWQEVDQGRCSSLSLSREQAMESSATWFPFIMGGNFRRWYGNREFVVNWHRDGQLLRTTRHPSEDRVWATNFNLEQIFLRNINWSGVTASVIAFRISPGGELFSSAGLACFPAKHLKYIAAFMNSKVAGVPLSFLSPSLSVNPGDIAKLPLIIAPREIESLVDSHTDRLFTVAKLDWDSYERSWEFQSLPILTAASEPPLTLESSYTAWITQNKGTIAEMKRLEEENNRLFIDAYGLQDELTPDVPIEQITLTVNPACRYGGKLTEEELWTRFRQDTMQELVSYAIGCMMGRYSLDAPGLIYAHSGNEGFDPSKYSKFPADKDGIVPLTELAWFEDDAAHRVEEFLSVAWNKKHVEDNLTFLADNLSPQKGESSRDTLRRYLCDSFFKDHLQTYKKRPIYWLFSSGKQKAFQCLVYLHRYHEGTLGRMRTEYVIPLQGRMASRIQQLEGDIAGATSTPHRKKLEKEKETLLKQRVELQEFDEKLRHYADQRIDLDLDDGVKVNYGKFGDLLAEVKAVTGGTAD